jgi:ataxin-3
MELQAALQASLGTYDELTIPTGPPRERERVPDHWQEAELVDEDDLDPVASSMARGRSAMQQMLRHQEYALREVREEEIAHTFPANRFAPLVGTPTSTAPAPQPNAPRRQRTRGEEDEDQALRRALEQSRADAVAAGVDVETSDDEDADYATPEQRTPAPVRSRMPLADLDAVGDVESFAHHTGVYDDDDAELQAALKASLEEVPGGAAIPPQPVVSRGAERTPPVSAPAPLSGTAQPGSSKLKAPVVDSEDEYDEDEDMEQENRTVEPSPEKQEQLDADELRRRRLARFGS